MLTISNVEIFDKSINFVTPFVHPIIAEFPFSDVNNEVSWMRLLQSKYTCPETGSEQIVLEKTIMNFISRRAYLNSPNSRK